MLGIMNDRSEIVSHGVGDSDISDSNELYVYGPETSTTPSDLGFEIQSLPNYINITEDLFVPVSNVTEHSCREPSLWELSTDYDNGDTLDAVSPETDVGEIDLDHSILDFKSFNYAKDTVPNNRPIQLMRHSQLQSQRIEVNSNSDSDASDSKAPNSYNINNFSHQKKPSSIGGRNHWGDSNSKNAIAARDNRLKKKQYVTGLEDSVKLLREENKQLLEENKSNKKLMNGLKKEVSYLRSVIANQTTLAAILKNVTKTPGIRFSSCLEPMGSKVTNKPGTRPTLESKTIVQNSRENTLSELIVNNEHVPQGTRKLRSSKLYPMVEPQTVSKRKCNEAAKASCSKRQKTDDDHLGTINVEDTDSESSSEEFSSEMHDDAGICLHVSGSSVSLELCSHCNSKAYSEVMTDHTYVKS